MAKHPMPVASSEDAPTLLKRGKAELQKAKTDRFSLIVLPDPPTLRLRVSKAQFNRAYSVLESVILNLSGRSYRIASGPTVEIDGLDIAFGVSEHAKSTGKMKTPVVTTNQFGNPHRDYFTWGPTGKLSFQILSYNPTHGQRLQQFWHDSKRIPLESQPSRIADGIVAYGKALSAYLNERENLSKRHAAAYARVEAARERDEENQVKLTELRKNAKLWQESCLIREYLVAAKASYIERFEALFPDSDFARWLTWATEQADRLDPLVVKPNAATEAEDEILARNFRPEFVESVARYKSRPLDRLGTH